MDSIHQATTGGMVMNSENSQPAQPARRLLRWTIVGIIVVVFLPLILDSRFRKFIAVSLLGIFYSVFLINVWQRWTDHFDRGEQSLPARIYKKAGRALYFFFPIRAWGAVPFIVELIVGVSLFVFGWFLAPLFYEIIHNPSTLGWIRNMLETSSPEFYQFLGDLTYATDPYSVLRENAQQIFTSLNRFFATFVLPLNFLFFTGIGALIYDPIEGMFRRIEKNQQERSRILDGYSRLFEEYLKFNTIYYIILGVIIGTVLALMDGYGLTQFGWKIIVGILITFALGNLLVPGLGTLIATVLILGMLYLWQGLIGAGIAGIIFLIYFMLDDYLVKPSFLLWIGKRPGREWEFGVEVIVFWLIILYASFGLVGTLLLFPGLCFLDAYMRDQYPSWRKIALRPLKSLAEET